MAKKRTPSTKSNGDTDANPKANSSSTGTSHDEKNSEQLTNPASNTQNTIITFLTCSVALSLAWHTAKQQLVPLYGSASTEVYFTEALTALLIISAFIPSAPKQYALPALSGMFIVTPMLLQIIGVAAAKLRSPVLGPLISYVIVLGPTTTLLQGLIKDALFSSNSTESESEQRYKLTKRVILTLLPSVIVTQTQQQCAMTYSILSKLSLSPSHVFIILGVASCVTHELNNPRTEKFKNSSSTSSAISQIIPFITDWPVLLTILLLPISLIQPPLRPLTLPYSHPSGALSILSSTQSLTGRIVVGEDHQHGFRYLRADHSLLGGVWIGDKVVKKGSDGKMLRGDDADVDKGVFGKDLDGKLLGDSIYSTFVLQEAVRFFEREGEAKNALIIGLGIGISAQSFMSHNLSTTVIEIDPAVYTAARQYFGLEEPSRIYLEDARGWVAKNARVIQSIADPGISQNLKYDIIVHDCFSGGGVPEQLFTVEFWSDVKSVLSNDGIIAVNFAGRIRSPSPKAILLTLQAVFGQCRVFHDHPLDSEDDIFAQFINLVFFCTPSPNLNFRPAAKADYLDSYLREHILGVFEKRELSLHYILGSQQETDSDAEKPVDDKEMQKWILKDKVNMLGVWQKSGALEHWFVMRNVLPDVFWETY